MNNTFKLDRFLLLFKKHCVENIKQNLLATVVLAGILLVAFVYIMFMTRKAPTNEIQLGVFTTFFLLTGSIYTSTIFGDLAGKKKAIYGLILPTSQLEKYFVAWIFTNVVFPIVYVAVYYLIDFSVLTLSLKG